MTLFNQVNTRIDSLQAETSRRFDMLQGEMNQIRAESNRRFDRIDQRFDQILGRQPDSCKDARLADIMASANRRGRITWHA